jgi:integrase
MTGRFTALAGDYIGSRRAMGYKFGCQAPVVIDLARHLDDLGVEHLTITDAVAWATSTPAAAAWTSGRLGIARGFARFVHPHDPASEILPTRLLPAPSHRAVPYIYSDNDIARLIDAAGNLQPAHRADTYQTMVALIAVTGMRIGEIVRLDDGDVDLVDGLLTIRDSKFAKSRQVPLHPSASAALADYRQRRDERRTVPKTTAFFTSAIGTRVLRDNLSTIFPRLVREAGLRSPAGRRPPRAHDLRHTFAVRTLIEWHRRRIDVNERIPVLSAWLGHVDPANTYWYLTGVPELLAQITDRLDEHEAEHEDVAL